MFNAQQPTEKDLPTSAQLLKSTIIAIMVAIILLVMVILPAEYGTDPTGVGKLLGLKEMGDIKMSLLEESQNELSQENITSSLDSDSLDKAIVIDITKKIKVEIVVVKKLPEVRNGKTSAMKRYKKGIIIKPFLMRVFEKYFIDFLKYFIIHKILMKEK